MKTTYPPFHLPETKSLLCSGAQVQCDATTHHWCSPFVAGESYLHIFQWVVRKIFAKCFTTILKTITVGAPGMEFPGHHFMDHCSSPTYWYSVLVFHLPSLWESSSCAKYGQLLLWASEYSQCSHLLWLLVKHTRIVVPSFFFSTPFPHTLLNISQKEKDIEDKEL